MESATKGRGVYFHIPISILILAGQILIIV